MKLSVCVVFVEVNPPQKASSSAGEGRRVSRVSLCAMRSSTVLEWIKRFAPLEGDAVEVH